MNCTVALDLGRCTRCGWLIPKQCGSILEVTHGEATPAWLWFPRHHPNAPCHFTLKRHWKLDGEKLLHHSSCYVKYIINVMFIFMVVTNCFVIMLYYHFSFPLCAPKTVSTHESPCSSLEGQEQWSTTQDFTLSEVLYLPSWNPHGQGMPICFLTMRDPRWNIKHPTLKYFSQCCFAAAGGDGEGAPHKLALA